MYENFTIFEGLSSDEIKSLNPTIKEYEKGETIIKEGDSLKAFGMVVAGEVQVYNEDYNGNRNIIRNGDAGFLFGEALAVLKSKTYPVSVMASTKCKVMFIEYNSVLDSKLLVILARNNIEYREKVTLLSQRTTREKILSYLFSESKKNKSNSFYISFDRQSLADYLGVERSAMSTEISKLVKSGIIETDKNWFKLK